VAQKLRSGAQIELVDVREPVEQQVSQLPGARLIPYGELASRLDELDRQEDIVLFCRTGVRSGRALQTLLAAGFRKVKNLRGGINAWSDEVDPTVMKY
jgi:adenylyltransferase/sulfurtransferase